MIKASDMNALLKRAGIDKHVEVGDLLGESLIPLLDDMIGRIKELENEVERLKE